VAFLRSSALSDRPAAYVIFRLSLGINILIHGAGRIFGTGAAAFASKTTGLFAATALPHGLTYAFLAALPYAELILGTMITAGLFTTWALILGGLLINVLIFGTALRADWAIVGIQMIYAMTYYLLLLNVSDNRFSLDSLILRRHT